MTLDGHLRDTSRVLDRLSHRTSDPHLLTDPLTQLGLPHRHTAHTPTAIHTLTGEALALQQTALRLLDDADAPQRTQLEQDLRDTVRGLQAGLAEIRALQSREPPPTRR